MNLSRSHFQKRRELVTRGFFSSRSLHFVYTTSDGASYNSIFSLLCVGIFAILPGGSLRIFVQLHRALEAFRTISQEENICFTLNVCLCFLWRSSF